jgi:alpha-glucosidase
LDPALAGRYYGQNDEFHLVFNFGPVNLPWEARAIRTSVEGLEAALPAGALPALVLGSHDEPRLATRVGEQARAAAMLLLTLRGVPFIYYGDEIGMADGPIPEERRRDPWPLISGLPQLSRDPARTPMLWDASPRAGFSPAAEVEPWLPIHPEYRQHNVQAQLADPKSLLNLYRALLRLRRQTPALHSGSYRPVDGVPVDTYVYFRAQSDQELLVALNFASAERVIALDDPRPAEILLSTEMDRQQNVELNRLRLRGNEGVVVRLPTD